MEIWKLIIHKEFVIDIDMDDYNNVRTCCADANICGKCWKYMKEAYVVIERALKGKLSLNVEYLLNF